jgi:hypothetical protein
MVLQVGVNDMWTTNPGLASLLADPEDGFKYMQSSNVKLDWICPQCGMLIKDRSPNLFQKQGLFCPICSDGISTPNKFVTSVLHHLGVDFKPEKMFSWNPKKIYDFYVQEPDCLIEVHGLQHYEDYRFSRRKPRGLKEEQENDKQKQECALANGIQHYIIIDARYTELEWMRNSILKSELSTLFDLGEVNWDSCYKDACHSKLIEACELYQSGYSLEEIIGKLHRSRSSIIRYIKSGSNIGLCKPYKNRNFKKVICLNTSEVFDNIKAAQRAYGTSEHISNCCAGVRRYCGTHPMTGEKLNWMYLQDYNKRHESTQPGAFI